MSRGGTRRLVESYRSDSVESFPCFRLRRLAKTERQQPSTADGKQWREESSCCPRTSWRESEKEESGLSPALRPEHLRSLLSAEDPFTCCEGVLVFTLSAGVGSCGHQSKTYGVSTVVDLIPTAKTKNRGLPVRAQLSRAEAAASLSE